MICYPDTSLIVAAFTSEIGTASAQAWLSDQVGKGCAVSAWLETEISSALSKKIREKKLDSGHRDRILSTWRAWRDATARILPVHASAFRSAAQFADRHDLGLRAGDALHIAIAFTNGCTLATLDRTMAAAARECGVTVIDLSD